MLRIIYIKQGNHYLSIKNNSVHWNLNHGDVFIFQDNQIKTKTGDTLDIKLDDLCVFVDVHQELHLINKVIFDFIKLMTMINIPQFFITYHRDKMPESVYVFWSMIYVAMMIMMYFYIYDCMENSRRIMRDIK